MIYETNKGVVYPNFHLYLQDASNKMYGDDFHNDMYASNLDEILFDSHMDNEISIL